MAAAMQGVGALVHLAGATHAYDLETLFQSNARGLWVSFEAARLAGVRRIAFASSNHAFGCWPITERVTPAHPPRPDSLYGALKVMGETMLRYYFDRHGIRSVSVRIGTCRRLPMDQRSLATWLSPADVTQLFERALLHDDPGCLVVNGYSGNTRLRTFDPDWSFLGYVPEDDAERHLDMLRAQRVDVDGAWEWPEHGGAMARQPEPR
jgi:uronate dehydrogenase